MGAPGITVEVSPQIEWVQAMFSPALAPAEPPSAWEEALAALLATRPDAPALAVAARSAADRTRALGLALVLGPDLAPPARWPPGVRWTGRRATARWLGEVRSLRDELDWSGFLAAHPDLTDLQRTWTAAISRNEVRSWFVSVLGAEPIATVHPSLLADPAIHPRPGALVIGSQGPVDRAEVVGLVHGLAHPAAGEVARRSPDLVAAVAAARGPELAGSDSAALAEETLALALVQLYLRDVHPEWVGPELALAEDHGWVEGVAAALDGSRTGPRTPLDLDRAGSAAADAVTAWASHPTRPPPLAEAVHSRSDGPLPLVDPASAGLDPIALDVLIHRAVESRSDALALWVDGRTVIRWPEVQEPIESMSMTKSAVDLGIGLLVDEGRIASLDRPTSAWFPEWEGDPRGEITLRMLLEHTSGLRAPPSNEIYAAPDMVAFALSLPLESEPGAAWNYNNAASNLIAAIGSRAAGMPFDDYVRQRLLDPLGVVDSPWMRDPAGNVHGMAGLALTADDWVTIGRMMLDGGTWDGQRLVSESWIADSVAPSPRAAWFGRQWWTASRLQRCVIDDAVVDAWKASGVDPDFLLRIAPLVGRDLGDRFGEEVSAALGGGEVGRAWWDATTWKAGRPDCTPERQRVGFRADGWLGQQLVVIPELRLVAVRQMRSTPEIDRNGDAGIDTFKDFEHRVVKLVPSERWER